MFISRFLPDNLKELVKHVPSIIFELVNWQEILEELPILSKRLMINEGQDNLIKLNEPFYKQIGVNLEQSSKLIKRTDKAWGIKLLELYFIQFLSPHGLFLDLRSSELFSYEDNWFFRPSFLWTKFDQDFRAGLTQMYEGFYTQDDSIFTHGLIKTGLMQSDWSLEDKNKLKNLFKEHFSQDNEDGMLFRLDQFKSSFMKIMTFLLEKKVKVKKDFLYLGIYLVTLYLALERLDEKIKVSDVYLNLLKKVKNDEKIHTI